MDQEQAERFLEAAQKGYAEAVNTFIMFPDRQALRESVLAAQQVLELARTEMHRAEVGYQEKRAALEPSPADLDLAAEYGRRRQQAREHGLDPDSDEGRAFLRWEDD